MAVMRSLPPRLLKSAITPAAVLDHLHRLERNWWIAVMALLAVGGVGSFLGPALAASIYWLAEAKYTRWPPAWWDLFLRCCVVVIPLMYMLAWITKGSLTEEFADETDAMCGPMLWGFRGRAALGLLILDLLLFAPRAVFHGLEKRRARAAMGTVDLPRIANALIVLASSEDGISPARLLKPNEAPEVLEGIFQYLLLHEQIGISKKGDHIWLASTTRQKLTAQP